MAEDSYERWLCARAVGEKFKGLKMIPAGLHLLIVGTGHGSKVGV
jgi:hypothetical protein